MVQVVAQATSASNPLGGWIIAVGGLLLLGFLIYAFVTRFRGNWDDLLRRWTATGRTAREIDDDPPTRSSRGPRNEPVTSEHPHGSGVRDGSRRPRLGVGSILRGYDRELTCGRCRSVIAWIRLGPWRLLRITDVNRYEVTPHGTETTVRVLQTRLATLQDTAARQPWQDPDTVDDIQTLRELIDYVRDRAGEVFYELECPCGARYLRSLPHLARTVRAAPAGRVVLR